MSNPHTKVVRLFNLLGYTASFAAVARRLSLQPESLYARYPSCEALGEAWLTHEIPKTSDKASLHGMFSSLMHTMLQAMEDQRDFSRAWLAALKPMGALHLPQLRNLHSSTHGYFVAWVEANSRRLSLPEHVWPSDVSSEIADAMCAAALWLLCHWETDRSVCYCDTRRMVDAVGYLMDGLLMRREEFGDAGLLLHLHGVVQQQHARFLQPLLDILVKPERAQRLVDPVNLFEALRNLRLPPLSSR